MREKQFGLIQPSTKTRLDVGINLKNAEGKLERSGSWNTMVSHRVKLDESDNMDDQLIRWLREAYEQAG